MPIATSHANSADTGAPVARTRALAATRGAARERIESIDLARGVAVCLMILSHGVNGMLAFEQIPDWGMVPVHAVTKIASSLFILVFGIALAVAFVPYTQADDWPRRRFRLLVTGVTVLFWYKLLTVVEMAPTQSWDAVVDALLYRAFPSYVEILGFYAIALLWIPFVLPWWARMPLAARIASPVVLGVIAWLVQRHVDFSCMQSVQAILVEHPDHYTWGQLSRGPLVLAGLLIGDALLRAQARTRRRLFLALCLGVAGALSLGAFFVLAGAAAQTELMAIARNAGKHPPETMFMLFSVGGALLFLALALAGGNLLAAALRPVTLIGTNALQAFVFHIVVIFIGLRMLLGYHDTTTYAHALTLTLILIAATSAWIALQAWLRRRLFKERAP